VEFRVAPSPSSVERKQAGDDDDKWADDPVVQAAKGLGAEIRPID
jgi:hypothetical protein